MNNIPCEVIKDLLPSYIDGLTTTVTNEVVSEHLKGCESCKAAYDSMRNSSEEKQEVSNKDIKEIDFLKKNRKRNVMILVGSVVAAIVLIAGILFVRLQLIGNKVNMAAIKYSIVKQDENKLVITIAPDGEKHSYKSKISKSAEGVDIELSESLTNMFGANTGSYEIYVDIDEATKEIKLNNKTVWFDGTVITPGVAAAYIARHDYMGDMPANGKSALAVGLYDLIGSYTNELKSTEEPYEWIINLEEEVASSKQSMIEQGMINRAYVILATVKNLGKITFNYSVGGEAKTLTVESGDASNFFGGDIKGCYDDIAKLQALYEKMGMK
ncbi:MAG: DUF4825 domain-containing protein [Lachnospiraceae bacterium]|nr:DUF4825 domain-containing protein [Lachnospiraceae bacterium]